MITYSERWGKGKFDWYEALRCDKPNWTYLTNLSSSWVTCACGNQCDIIPRSVFYIGEPKDQLLRDLGMYFTRAVKNKDVEAAVDILDRIEFRALEIMEIIILIKKS